VIAARAKVGELAEQVRGVSYGKQDASPAPLPGYLPVLRAGNITDAGLVFDDLVFVPAERISTKQRIRRHDVVIAASSGSLDVVGKAALALHDSANDEGPIIWRHQRLSEVWTTSVHHRRSRWNF
jgi:type I restriction enzyme, S subunit